MCKKVVFPAMILLFLLFLIGVPAAFADASAQLKQAEQLFKEGQYQQAEAIYQQILIDYPATDAAFAALTKLPCVYIAMGKQTKAEVAFDQLLADFPNHERLPHAIHEIVENCSRLGEADSAKQLCQHVLDNQPHTEQAIWLHMGVALSNVYVDDANGVKFAVDKLVADFHDRTDLPTALFQIGAGYYKQALVRLKDAGSFPSAKEYFLRAQGLWKRIIQEFPEHNPSDTADAHYFSGVCCRYLGEYLDAITHYRAVVDNWPGYPYAWNAQFLIGYCYKQLSVLGAVSESVAHAQIKAACEQVVQKYPDCPAAAAARDWLKNN